MHSPPCPNLYLNALTEQAEEACIGLLTPDSATETLNLLNVFD